VRVLLAVAAASLACGRTGAAPQTALRECVDLRGGATSRINCFKDLRLNTQHPQRCAILLPSAVDSAAVPVNNDRLEELIAEAKQSSPSESSEFANAPFVFKVDWAGVPVGDEGHRADGWLRGGVLGATAIIYLDASTENGQLVNTVVRPDGEVIPGFLDAAQPGRLGQAAKALQATEARLEALRQRLDGVYTGLYRALHSANATTPCYLRFASAHVRMEDEISRLAKTVLASRVAVQARKMAAEREAAERREEALAWTASHVERCRKAETRTDCGEIDAYLAKYPAGLHAVEARAALASGLDAIQRARDLAAWAGANVPRCASPATSDACDDVKRYLEQHPNGAHAAQASELLRRKRFPLAQLAASEDTRRRLAAVRKRRGCLDECVKALHRCHSACRAGDPSALPNCQRACLSGYEDTCSRGCKL
jgi:hypothetical protein